ncbi:MAG: YgiQ family radical SAM protein [Bacteroidales bacterium]|nr:YgiQ family radical SAM protein [Bacteroidales bacterium]
MRKKNQKKNQKFIFKAKKIRKKNLSHKTLFFFKKIIKLIDFFFKQKYIHKKLSVLLSLQKKLNTTNLNITNWLPTTAKEVKERGWDELDIILFTGDAYVDHPAFGAAVIGRSLEAEGYKVAIVPQPNWQDDLRDFKKLGKPRLFFAVTSGNMDSMINHYTSNRRLRSDDAYSAGGKAGFRPDYATYVYSQNIKEIYPDIPVVIGGIEASLRRFTHYDYWQNKLKPSILAQSKADLLIYGNGEHAIIELANLLDKGVPFNSIKNLSQSAILSENYKINKEETIVLHSHEECLKDKKKFAENFKLIEIESNSMTPKIIVQQNRKKLLVVNPPVLSVLQKEIDKSFDLPYTRLPHPKYQKRGAIPAFEMIKFSINIHRGCFGGCSFCTISAHQGKFVLSRSEKSILKEAKKITQMPDFKGHISDLGGPSANMYMMQGVDIEKCKKCKRSSCIYPSVCSNLNTNHTPLIEIYKKVREHDKVKQVTIGSGIRYDLLFDENTEIRGDKLKYTQDLIKHHISGRLKVAPEHTSEKVLKIMRKPSFKLFHRFKKYFDGINNKTGLNQQLIPYFISSHPGSTDADMADLAIETKSLNFKLEQVQDLTPTPLTAAAVMFYTGFHPYTLEKIHVAKSKQEKLDQKMFFFWYKPEFRDQIKAKLRKIGKTDMIDKLFGKKK